MKYPLSSAAVIAILAGTPALAANDKTTTNVRPPVSVDFVNAQTKQDWLSANLVGASVENPPGGKPRRYQQHRDYRER